MSAAVPSRDETYISIDVEAAGPIPGVYSTLALGACVVGRLDETFYVELRPVNNAFVLDAMRVSGLSLDKLRRSGRDAAEAMREFGLWVERCSAGTRPVFVAFNASFDWSFVNWYFHQYLGENPFGIGGVDIKAYYMGLARCTWAETTSSKLPERFRSALPHTHNALDDARAQADTFAKLLAVARIDS